LQQDSEQIPTESARYSQLLQTSDLRRVESKSVDELSMFAVNVTAA
jgi:hypothetical protein